MLAAQNELILLRIVTHDLLGADIRADAGTSLAQPG